MLRVKVPLNRRQLPFEFLVDGVGELDGVVVEQGGDVGHADLAFELAANFLNLTVALKQDVLLLADLGHHLLQPPSVLNHLRDARNAPHRLPIFIPAAVQGPILLLALPQLLLSLSALLFRPTSHFRFI